MIRHLRNGGELPPVIVCGEIAFSGSHRLVAWDRLGMDPSIIKIEDRDIAAGMLRMGLDPIYDEITKFNDFETALTDLGIV